VEGKGRKELEHGPPATNLSLTGHAWPPLNPYFHPPLHLASSKVKQIPFILFKNSIYLLIFFLIF
jgi:hypothetical protein